MKFVGTVKIVPEIPENIRRLKELSYNMWWCWNPEAVQLYKSIDEDLWERVCHNPVKFLLEVTQEKLEKASKSKSYQELYAKVFRDFDFYMKGENTSFKKNFSDLSKDLIAYFSAEYGIHESLPIYSGGLGVLSGDHVKTASDMGIPLVGVGLLYKQGYFTQRLNAEGWQEAVYYNLDFSQLPLNKALSKEGEQIVIDVDLPGRKVFANLWFVQVGRVRVYLLDTNIEKNHPEDRWFTSQLYGGDQETRITQEILLGMGGVKALQKLGLSPTIWHMNEGHSVFMALERIRELVEREGLSFSEALEYVRATTIFTTHTPVPAGNETFPHALITKYFKTYWERVKITEAQFMELGRDVDLPQMFSLTILALKLSAYPNGVSELHGHVSRKLWGKVWDGIPSEENPITHVTNGVHTFTWISEKFSELYDRHMGMEWRENLNNKQFWKRLWDIPDRELWEAHLALKKKMVDFVREKAIIQWMRYGIPLSNITEDVSTLLNPEHLTIGFARRFATYKRAILIFRDRERLKAILNNPERPVQIVFSGKAHPKDKPGQEFIKFIFDLAKEDGFKGKIFFVEDYDMNVARYLIQGVDVWLNTPRRPYEASGTSGQKGPINGIINFSVLDGWWREAFFLNPECGWSIGRDEAYPQPEAQDMEDSAEIYNKLEKEIIPLYYERGKENIPVGWVKKMKSSIETVLPLFSTTRMLSEYIDKLYTKASAQEKKLKESLYQGAKNLSVWKASIKNLWGQVSIESGSVTRSDGFEEISLEKGFAVQTVVRLGNIKPEDVLVEIYYRKIDDKGNVMQDKLFNPMKVKENLGNGKYLFEGFIKPENGGHYEYTIRVIPFNLLMAHKHELGLVQWLE